MNRERSIQMEIGSIPEERDTIEIAPGEPIQFPEYGFRLVIEDGHLEIMGMPVQARSSLRVFPRAGNVIWVELAR